MEGVSWSGFNVLDSSETDRKCTVKIYHCGPIGIGHRHQLGIRPRPWSPRIVGIAENSQSPSCWASAWTGNTLSDGVETMLDVNGYKYRQKTNQVQIERRFSVVVLQSRVVCDRIISVEPWKCRLSAAKGQYDDHNGYDRQHLGRYRLLQIFAHSDMV